MPFLIVFLILSATYVGSNNKIESETKLFFFIGWSIVAILLFIFQVIM